MVTVSRGERCASEAPPCRIISRENPKIATRFFQKKIRAPGGGYVALLWLAGALARCRRGASAASQYPGLYHEYLN
jgi:hypothetical protein